MTLLERLFGLRHSLISVIANGVVFGLWVKDGIASAAVAAGVFIVAGVWGNYALERERRARILADLERQVLILNQAKLYPNHLHRDGVDQ